uniref:NADH-ubiquinone oxidoreductase chain 4 n=2 Tax=Riftia pachyptila TaxID=6426 RepID=A0A0E3DQZ1_RIFPA|nr:NADH dehydrogenase subunit 4 [Riftia pachyptila]AIL54844.1 NADH dehydrogenase subunit 4 [Riftia pachyptila]WAB69323.1 NADH dehydrogenase subunit 4 [Riftia pachyptila]WLD05574.1 NADH dehydrogenase subunit 4 [Riftia pachyptila]
MLMILMPLISLPLLSKSWFISSSFLLLSIPFVLISFTNPYPWTTTMSSLFSVDLMSSTLIILTLWISSLMIMASYKIKHNHNMPKNFIIMCLSLSISLILTFSSSNLFMFYIFFETSLIPILILILTWGYQPERLQASMYLMMYTLTASLPMLVMIFLIYSKNNHLSFLMSSWLSPFPNMMNIWWFILILAFLVKMPMFSLHLWLPKAHVEAPVAGSMILAGVLLKLGTYGLMRMSLIFTFMNKQSSSIITPLALWGAVVTSLICIRQTDLKALIAYSSIGHMGILLAGILSSTEWGWQGAMAMMIAHGLSSSALFLLANTTYELTHTRSIFLTKGMIIVFPTLTLWWFIATAANMAAPPSINLLSEILLITATLSQTTYLAIFLMLLSFLTAAYSLFLFASTQHGATTSTSISLPPLNSSFFLNSTLHLVPIFLLILKPELICNWL